MLFALQIFISSMQLNYKLFGSGPALVILHGLFGSLDNWQTLAKQFAEDFSVFIVDQRNHGKSPHTDAHTYALMAEDLKEFMDQQGMYTATVIGHSMGGKTAMQFAVEHEERLEKLVVVDMSPRKNEPGHLEILDAMSRFPMDQIQSRKEADEILKQDIPELGVRAFLLKNIERTRTQGFQWKFNLDTLSKDYYRILDQIESPFSLDVPTLFINGGKSDYVVERDREIILNMFPQAEFSTIEGAGHWVHADAPVEFYNRISNWLKK